MKKASGVPIGYCESIRTNYHHVCKVWLAFENKSRRKRLILTEREQNEEVIIIKKLFNQY
ncbi:hypothetical protein EAY46_15125 [Vibrio anguillarum]|uniref:Uncharacterized protein n=1 Tax=Vibrio anguillarum TaxID=55601 RepID=A0ABR9Z7F9_VIBAN|nr:hypothetical protein [Vibrio anguillarum]